METKTLNDVILETFNDSKFFDDLLADRENALSGKGWTLSPKDNQELQTMLERQEVDGRRLLQIINTVIRGSRPWDPPPWGVVVPRDDEMV